MYRISSSAIRRSYRRLSSFTLVELLTVIVIIALLAALTLAAGGAVLKRAARVRATNEIQAMGAGLANYKVDNGVFPIYDMNPSPPLGVYPADPSTLGGVYQFSSELLYQALSGKTNYTDPTVAGTNSYVPFKSGQLGSLSNNTYVKDPFGFSYGYSTGDTTNNVPYNGDGFYDLWSTGGTTGVTTANPNYTNTWLVNWKQS